MDDMPALRESALNELKGNTSAPIEVTEPTVEMEVESEPTEILETEEETQQEQAPVPKEKKETSKKDLYKALGKKDKRIQELEALIAEKSTGFDDDSLELINAIAKKQSLEGQLEREEANERDAFMSKLPKEMRETLEEELEENPNAWRTVQKFYKPASLSEKPSTPKSNIGIVGESGPTIIKEKTVNDLTLEEHRELLLKDIKKTGKLF